MDIKTETIICPKRSRIIHNILIWLFCMILMICPINVRAEEGPSYWAEYEVTNAINMGLVPLDMRSAYQTRITRLEFCRLAMIFIEAKSGKSVDALIAEKGGTIDYKAFDDTNELYVLQANALGIIEGTGDKIFSPSQAVTRQEAATLLMRVSNAANLIKAVPVVPKVVYSDAEKISSWAAEGVNFAATCQNPLSGSYLMGDTGSNRFNPRGYYTREQAYVAVQRLFNSTVYLEYAELSVLMLPSEELSAGISSSLSQGYFGNWNSTAEGYIVPEGNGFMVLTVGDENNLYAALLDSDMKSRSTYKIKRELPIFGGFYKASDGNFYVMFGALNKEQEQNREVIRIVKYDSGWKRLDSLSVKAKDTITRVPFDCGNAKMDDYNGILSIYTSRERYTSADGLNHESNLLIRLNMTSMNAVEISGQYPEYYVSHSFDQFVKYDGGKLLLVDHGDAYPRSISLQVVDPKKSDVTSIDLIKISGENGDNYTGVTPGGFEISSGSYLLTANSVDQQKFNVKSKVRNALLCIVPKSNPSGSKVKLKWLTNYSSTGNKIAGVPSLVKVSDDVFVVLWEEYEFYPERSNMYSDTKYLVIDGEGNTVKGAVSIRDARLGENIQPMYRDGRVIWFAVNPYGSYTNYKGIYLYTLAIE